MKIKEKNKQKQFKIKDKLKQSQKILMILRYSICLKAKKIFNELVDERLEKITDLDKKVNSNDLIHRYKGNTADAKFGEFDILLISLIRYEMVKQT